MNMYAHTHTDAFKLFMSYTKPSAPVGVMHVCGSVTTWIGNNPGFCVYEVDAETLLPLKRTTYAFNMDTANTKGNITWTAYTNFIKDYSLPDLSPTSFLNLAIKTKSQAKVAGLVQTKKTRSFTSSTCNTARCMLEVYCNAVNIDPIEHSDC